MSDPTREAPCAHCGSDWHYTGEHDWKPPHNQRRATTTPAPLDVERLARALKSDAVRDIAIHYEPERAAEAIAREYAKP